MQLNSITIYNFRSVKKVNFPIKELADKSYTFGLIGENEAGKSSILKGIAIKDLSNGIAISNKDYTDKDYTIDIRFEYSLQKKEFDIIIVAIKNLMNDIEYDEKQFENIIIEFSRRIDSTTIEYYLVYSDFEDKEEFIQFSTTDDLYKLIEENVHNTIFWSYDDKYLISKEINLSSFFSNPHNVSVPLTNCFLLAGYKIDNFTKLFQDIASDSTEREDVREKLGDAVTKHIKRVWKNHDIKISFDLTSEKINFHVKDLKSKGKSKTAEQRSDGFKRFVSFLLTVSAQHKNSQLKKTILLLDEPETHLHPKAQEFFLDELIEISKSNNNLVFFATHSNYFIDKKHLERNFKVVKNEEFTSIHKFDEKLSSYASVNYDVFNIVSTDYHNELYGKAQDIMGIENNKVFDSKIKEIIKRTPIKKDYQHTNSKTFDCTLPTYIRHQIHHPENELNPKFKEKELEDSIIILREFINEVLIQKEIK